MALGPIISFGLKVAPTILAGYRALRQELLRTSGHPLRDGFASLDPALDEAIGLLAGQASTTIGEAGVAALAMLTRPALFAQKVPAAWIRSGEAQQSLKQAALAYLRDDPDSFAADRATAHYALFLDEDEDGTAPTADEVYEEALRFILASLERKLTPGERVVMHAIGGINERLDRLAFDNSDLVDDQIRSAITRLKQTRFFRSANAVMRAGELYEYLSEGRGLGGSLPVRGWALAWCARLTSFAEPELAAKCLAEARRLAPRDTEEVRVAIAFMSAAQDWREAIAALDITGSRFQATVALQIIRFAHSPADTLTQLRATGLDFEMLDADGRFALITLLIEADAWAEARAAAARLAPEDFDEQPALLWIAATVLVAATLPADLRRSVLQDLPINTAIFRLPEGEAARAERRVAQAQMMAVAGRCAALDLPEEAGAAERYALWLALRDPEQRETAFETLKARWDQPARKLDYLSLALSFGIAVDRAEAQRLIELQRARKGPSDPKAGSAILTLLLHCAPHDPAFAADLLTRYDDVLREMLAPTSFIEIAVNLLRDAGRTDDADKLLASVEPSQMPDDLRHRLALERAGEPSLEDVEAAYAQAPDTRMLMRLLHAHQQAGYSERYFDLARQLLRETPNARDAREIIAFLTANDHDEQAAQLLVELGDIVEQSDELLGQAAFVHFRAGRIAEADRVLKLLEARRDAEQDRQLRYQLIVLSGQWPELEGFIEQEWTRRAARSPLELMRVANLAAHLRSPRTRDLIRTAVDQGRDDPHVLSGAYSAATTAGIEEQFEDGGGWIMRAAELSGKDGPVQQMSLEQIFEQKPDWDNRVDEAYRALAAGQIPISAAAQLLRRPWSDLQLIPLLTNRDQRDARRHSVVPLYSGFRDHGGEQQTGDHVALDRSAIVTLAVIDLLDTVLDRFDRVYVAHDLLNELFEERQRIDFHQPSRIAFAHQLITMLNRGTVLAFTPSTVPDLALVSDIGESLATLLSEAIAHVGGQHIVVHPYPITRVGSFRNDEVALGAYSQHLCSCLAVLEAVERAGRLTLAEAAQARDYLNQHDRHWPDEPVVERGATLYLSDLSVSYFRYTGLLDRIEAAGLKVIVARSELDEARALREMEARSERVGAVIEKICRALAPRIAQGTVVLDVIVPERDEFNAMMALSGLAARADTLVCDDRFVNRYENFELDGTTSRICTTVALIESLAREGHISAERHTEVRAHLRLDGAIFMPLSEGELSDLLAAGNVRDGQLRETAELRAVRENMRLAQLRGWFDRKADTKWLLGVNHALSEAIAAQWNDDIADETARARSNWVLQLCDMRDWADSIVDRRIDELASHGINLNLGKLCLIGFRLGGDAATRFAAWLEQDVLQPIWLCEPHLRAPFLAQFRAMMTSMADELTPLFKDGEDRRRLRLAVRDLPEFLLRDLCEDDDFRERLGLNTQGTMTVGTGPTFAGTAVADAIRALYAQPDKTVPITDSKRRKWQLGTEQADGSWPLVFTSGKTHYRVRGSFALHPTAKTRLAAFDALLAELNIPHEELMPWRLRLDQESELDRLTIDRMEADLDTTPGAVASVIAQAMGQQSLTIPQLVPDTRIYYERLTGTGEAEDLSGYAAHIVPAHIAIAQDLPPLEQTKRALLLASQATILAEGRFPVLSDEEWLTLAQWVRNDGDLLAKIGFFERAVPHAHRNKPLAKQLLELTIELELLDPTDEGGPLHFLSSLVVLVDGELSRQTTLSHWPPFRRRIAAFAQSAMIQRIATPRLGIKNFSAYCLEQRSWRYFAQNLVDLRQEPRWRPDHIVAAQLKNEIIGRMVSAAGAAGASLPPALKKALVADKNSVRSRMAFPMTFWPGPIEGGVTTERQEPPADLVAALDTKFDTDTLDPSALALLANLDGTFNIPAEQLDRAISAIRSTGAKILARIEPEKVPAHLQALAYLSASYRRPDLAEHVEMLIRQHRARGVAVETNDQILLALVTAAAHQDPDDWRRNLGRSLLELADSLNDEADAQTLSDWIDTLCEIDPLLRATTGRAKASLRLVLGR